jgi:hypothetical protein
MEATSTIKARPGLSGALWMVAGAAALLLCMLVVLHVRDDEDPAAQIALRAQRVELVQRMQSDLASASEAEKSAVLAITDQESQTFADEARAASAKVEQARRELEETVTARGTPDERESMARFTATFIELQRIDRDLLALTVKNTNVKAYRLAYGPSASALGEMNAALSRLVAAYSNAPAAKQVMLLAFGAQTSALRIQTLLPPHIAEENDQKMDALEAQMTAEDAQVRKDLDGLATLPKVGQDPDLATAAARYAELGKLRAQILALSRENTNVRSLSISLNAKRRALVACEDALGMLERATQTEPIDRNGAPPRPR